MYNDFNNSVGSGWQGILTQYWKPIQAGKWEEATPYAFISHTVTIGSSYTDTQAPPAGVTTGNLEAEIKKAIEAKGGKENWPKSITETSVNHQFAIFTQPGTTWEGGSGNPCGWHSSHYGSYTFDVISWEGGNGGLCNTTYVAAHEYVEAVTDPRVEFGVTGQSGWREWGLNGNTNELADICGSLGSVTWASGIEVPKIWDRQENECKASHANPTQKAPNIVAKVPTNVSGTKATLQGEAELNGLEVGHYWFQWGEGGGVYGHTGSIKGSQSGTFSTSETLTGLEPNRTYHYRLVVEDPGGFEAGRQTSADRSFTTVPTPPLVTIEAPSNIAAGTATLKGTVNPRGFSTTYRFQWGTTEAYGNTVTGEAGSGTAAKAVEAAIAGLHGQTTYFFRLYAESSEGHGEAKGSFTTPDWRPAATTEPATDIRRDRATLNGTVNGRGFPTTFQLQYVDDATCRKGEEASWTTEGEREERCFKEAISIPASDVRTTYASSFGSEGSGNGQFKYLADVGRDPTDGSLWTADFGPGHERVQHFSASGLYLGSFAAEQPGAVAVDAEGNVYVATMNSAGYVRKYSREGKLIKQIAGPGTAKGQLMFPTGLAFDAEGNVWVSDMENHRIDEFTREGSYVKSIELGNYARPWGVSIAPGGNVWIADESSHGVSVYSSAGTLLFQFGSQGSGNGQFERPSDIEVDQRGYVWVADAVNDRIQVFNEAGEFIEKFGTKGSGAGQFNSEWYLRLAVSPNGNVWVSDEATYRVGRWRESDWSF